VVLEITERAALEEVDDVPGRAQRLRDLGFGLAVDDLGAGYAGLNSFAQLAPEYVKLDITLVSGIHRDRLRRKLIRSLTTLCSDMGITVVAEGVETPDERDTLVELGCDLLQGYLLGRPSATFFAAP
jgi:EAL domain-containing protein (putative c-di-GMP-specific phosphodiesterase class I)